MVKNRKSIAGFIPPVFNRDMKMKPVFQAARAVKIAKALKSGKLEGEDIREIIQLGKSIFQKDGQIGNKFINSVDVGRNSLMSETDNLIIVQENSSGFSNRKSSTINISEPMVKSFAKLPHRHNTTRRELINTDTDCINPKKRLLTISRCGFNQRTVDFFGQDTFLSVGNMKSFTQCEKHIDGLKKKNSETSHELANIGTNRSLYKKRKTNIEINALVKKVVTNIVVNSDMEKYCSRVSIHVCKMRNLDSECSENPLETLHGMYYETADVSAKSLRKDQIVKQFRLKAQKDEWEFKNSTILTIDANIRRSDIFQKNIQVLKTVNRRLEPNTRFDLRIIEHHERGINLNKLSKIQRDDLPAGIFLIVESIGDPRCVLQDGTEGVRYNGHSPVKLRYDYFVKIHYICSESKRDLPSTKMIFEPEIDFEDEELASEFYPDRETVFNVDLKNINIGGQNTEGRYSLGLDNEVVDQLGKINDYLRKTNQEPLEEEENRFQQMKTNTTDFSDVDTDNILDNVKPTTVFDNDDNDDNFLDLDE